MHSYPRLFTFACFWLFGFINPAWSQNVGTIEGTVTLPNGEVAHQASVLISELGRVVETDANGRFRFEDVVTGTFEVVAYQVALDSVPQSVTVSTGEISTVDIVLRLSPIRTEVTVTATGREQTAFQTVQSVTSLDAFDLSEAMAGSLGELLDGELGIAKRSFGAGSARPAIRGFDGDRVLIMQDGVSVGSLASQSGDHSEPIDPSNVERIEVLKGPATLLYGSNAVGGVVNAISSHQEVDAQPHQGVRGQVSTAVGSANAQAGGSFNVEVGTGGWMLWAGGGGQRTTKARLEASTTPRIASVMETSVSAGSANAGLPASTTKRMTDATVSLSRGSFTVMMWQKVKKSSTPSTWRFAVTTYG